VTAASPGPAPKSAPAKALSCAPAALTCVGVTNLGAQLQKDVPVTFGQVFAPGDLPAGSSVIALDGAGNALPLQVDQPATFPDGSIRFAILSTVLPESRPGTEQIVNLQRSDRAPRAAERSKPTI